MTAAGLDRPLEILLVEDNPGDITLTRVGLGESQVANHVSVAMDGREALAFLRREGSLANAPRPDLILLDLNLPGKTGHEVLAEIRADAALEDIPVVVLTTSDSEYDIREAYRLKANCYLTKPVDYEQFAILIEMLERFWFRYVHLPIGPRTARLP
ncbi:MAG: response regulator [Armatimonadetes bacterium]|nr:response regulator [Armatimonadota bacterium]